MALAEDMIQEVRQWLPERTFRIAGDGFYASLAGSRGTRHHLISRMRRDAALYDLPSPKPKGRRGPQPKKGPRLATPAALARRVQNWKKVVIPMRGRKVKRLVYARKVIWYKVSHTPVLLVISRDPQGKEPDDFLVTTDTAMKASEVVACFSGRWSIEDTFKWCKQMLGSQHPQTWKRHGPERAAMLGLWLYSVVWFWYLQQGKRKRTISWKPWYPHKAYPSFRDAIACLRKDLWRVRIKHIFGNSLEHDNVFEFLIESLAKAG